MEKESAAYDALLSVMTAVESGAVAEFESRALIDRDVQSVFAPLKSYFMQAALEKVGIEFDSEKVPTSASLTQFINEMFLSDIGLELSDAFNSESSQREIKALILEKVNERLGGEMAFDSLDIQGVTRAAKKLLSAKLSEQIRAGAGAMLEGLPDSSEVLAQIERWEKGQDVPLVEGAKAEGNRRRQATYRAAHSRHWETR